MHDHNAEAEDAPLTVQEPGPPPPGIDSGRGLRIWLGVLVVLGIGGLLLGQQEMALLIVLSGVCIAAQAADLHPRWEWLYQMLTLVMVGFVMLLFVALASQLRTADMDPLARRFLIAVLMASAGVSVLSLHVPFTNALARLLFRVPEGSHSLRLAARLTLFGLLFAVPFTFHEVFDLLVGDPDRLLQDLSVGGGLIGYIALALASVGFMVRRDFRATLERLGVRRPTLLHLGIMVVGAAALFALNSGGELAQRHWFPELWARDRNVSEAISGALSMPAAAMLGLSAGIGEEITLRGALQPRLGILLTSLLFAALHVQYSWFGMLMIFAFGLLLGTLRKRTSTTVAMGVHALYDIIALIWS